MAFCHHSVCVVWSVVVAHYYKIANAYSQNISKNITTTTTTSSKVATEERNKKTTDLSNFYKKCAGLRDDRTYMMRRERFWREKTQIKKIIEWALIDSHFCICLETFITRLAYFFGLWNILICFAMFMGSFLVKLSMV